MKWGLRDKSKRDSSASRTDSFTGAKQKKGIGSLSDGITGLSDSDVFVLESSEQQIPHPPGKPAGFGMTDGDEWWVTDNG
jgi:hypothetical protein